MANTGAAFAEYVARNLPQIEASLKDHAPQPTQRSAQSDDLDRYLYAPLWRFVSSGGKRIRPALCLLGAESVGGDAQAALAVASSVELFQAAALIHDDIADKSELRRGVPCLHIAEGVGLAINAGDAALVAVASTIVRNHTLDAPTRLRLLDELCVMEERTLEGQAMDLGWARDERWNITVDDYLTMARHKTAYYSAAVPLAMGAICAGGSDEQVEGLRQFGMDCGLAFQIQDDLLNLIGDEAAQGKDLRSDITEGKRTLVMVWALEHLDSQDRRELVGILSSHTSDNALLARAVQLAEQSGALAHAESFAYDLVRHAKAALDRVPVASDARAVLRSMADFFVQRSN